MILGRTVNAMVLLSWLALAGCALLDDSAPRKPEASGLIVTPPSYYSTSKARYLGTKYKDNLDRIVERITRNPKTASLQFANNISSVGGIGFFTHSATKSGDERYLEIVLATPETFEVKGEFSEKVHRLFARYGLELLGMTSGDNDIYQDRELSGYGLNLAWRNIVTERAGSRVALERAIIYFTKERVRIFLRQELSPNELLSDAVIFAVEDDGPLNLVSYRPQAPPPDFRPAIREDNLAASPAAPTVDESRMEPAKRAPSAVAERTAPMAKPEIVPLVVAPAVTKPEPVGKVAQSSRPIETPVVEPSVAKATEAVKPEPTKLPAPVKAESPVSPPPAVKAEPRAPQDQAQSVKAPVAPKQVADAKPQEAIAAPTPPVKTAVEPRAAKAVEAVNPEPAKLPAPLPAIVAERAAPIAKLEVAPPVAPVVTRPEPVGKVAQLPRPIEAPVAAPSVAKVTEVVKPEPAKLPAPPPAAVKAESPAPQDQAKAQSAKAPVVTKQSGDTRPQEVIAALTPPVKKTVAETSAVKASEAVKPEPAKIAVPVKVESPVLPPPAVKAEPRAPQDQAKAQSAKAPVVTKQAGDAKPQEAIAPPAKTAVSVAPVEPAPAAARPNVAKVDAPRVVEAKPVAPANEKPAGEQLALLKNLPVEVAPAKPAVARAAPKPLQGFIIQLAFNDKQKAQSWAETMEKRGFAVSLTEASGEGSLRVRLGNFAVRDEAERQLRAFKQDGLNGIVISLPQPFRPEARSSIP
jgi:cell division septation protein DedD